jgi:hypothetical protein
MHQTQDYEGLALKKAVIPGAQVPDGMTSSGASGMTPRVFWSTGFATVRVVFLGYIVLERSNGSRRI